MDKAIYAGSFDPITIGHMDIIKRAANIVDTLFIAVGTNPAKEVFFDLNTRINKLKQATKDIANVKVLSFSGMLVDCMHALKIKNIIRGIRNFKDYEYEKEISQVYKWQDNTIECIYILADPRFVHVSSSIVRQILANGGNANELIP